MSRNRRNNHYHYAEKFEPKRHTSPNGRRAYMPFKSVIVSLVVLLVFGLVSTTFATYVSDSEPGDVSELSPIIAEVRNMKADRDLAFTGANAELASTGGQYNYNWNNAKLYFRAPDGWNIGSTYKYYGVITRASSVSAAAYVTYTGVMTRIANTRLYYVNFSINHGNWGQNEYFAVVGGTATKTNSGDGVSNVKLNSHTYYTQPADYGMANNTYLATATATNTALSINYLAGSNSTDYDNLFKKTQTVNVKVGSSASTACGTVELTGYYNSVNGSPITLTSSSASSTLNSTSSAEYAGVEGSQMTLTATPATGYRFDGFYNSGGTKVSDVDALEYSYYVFGAATYTAKFVREYTVTAAKNPTAYTGNTPTADGESSVTVDSGSTVVLNAGTIPTGVTFGGWTFSGSKTFATGFSASSNPCNIIPSANVTATAKYTLDKPTISSLSYSAMVAGNSSSPTKSVTSPSSGTLNYSFSIAPKAGTTATAGTYSINSTTGVVTATTPGTYTVTMSVTTTNYGVTSAASTKTADVTVRPVSPIAAMDYRVHNYTGSYNHGTTGKTAGARIEVPIRSTTFDIQTYLTSYDSNYTYKWVITNGTTTQTIDTGTENGSNVTTTAVNASSGNLINTATAGNFYFTAYPVATYNSVDSAEPAAADKLTLYYKVTADYLEITNVAFSDGTNTSTQKIYAADSAPTQISFSVNAGGTQFYTGAFFSATNLPNTAALKKWTALAVRNAAASTLTIPNTSVLQGTWDRTDSSSYNILNPFNISTVMTDKAGVKYFRGYIKDKNNNNVTPAEPNLHTTVGAASTTGLRPLYFVDAYNTYGGTRLMAFFIASDGTTLRYQTAQKVDDNISRFYVPADAVSVTFMYASTDYYVLPTVSSGLISYVNDNTIYKALTPTISLTGDNVDKTAYTISAAGSGEGVQTLSGTLGTLS